MHNTYIKHITKKDYVGNKQYRQVMSVGAVHADKIQPVSNKNITYRNDPCPCGSGVKYKKCCLKN
jgi:uncharacterized protein YecA (UPF0149 family)